MMVRVAGVEPALLSELDFEVYRGFDRAETPWLVPLRTRAKGSAAAP